MSELPRTYIVSMESKTPAEARKALKELLFLYKEDLCFDYNLDEFLIKANELFEERK